MLFRSEGEGEGEGEGKGGGGGESGGGGEGDASGAAGSSSDSDMQAWLQSVGSNHHLFDAFDTQYGGRGCDCCDGHVHLDRPCLAAGKARGAVYILDGHGRPQDEGADQDDDGQQREECGRDIESYYNGVTTIDGGNVDVGRNDVAAAGAIVVDTDKIADQLMNISRCSTPHRQQDNKRVRGGAIIDFLPAATAPPAALPAQPSGTWTWARAGLRS